jgi:hypothetical protein
VLQERGSSTRKIRYFCIVGEETEGLASRWRASLASRNNQENDGMFRKLMLAIDAIGLAAGVLASGTPAHAQTQPVKAGLLSCHAASGFGLIFGTTREVNCAFAPVGVGAPAHHYIGHIESFGFDTGYTEAGVILWVVLAATTPPAPGALAGTFEPHPGSTFVGQTVATNTLIGGSGNTIALLPLDLQANTNVNDAAGVAKMTLTHQP